MRYLPKLPDDSYAKTETLKILKQHKAYSTVAAGGDAGSCAWQIGLQNYLGLSSFFILFV